ncbi:hypothetical protein ACLOJK_020980 [Asimina triloba]
MSPVSPDRGLSSWQLNSLNLPTALQRRSQVPTDSSSAVTHFTAIKPSSQSFPATASAYFSAILVLSMETTSSSSIPNSKAPAAADPESLRRNRILSSKLYFNVPPSKAPLIYSPSYNISFLGIEKLVDTLVERDGSYACIGSFYTHSMHIAGAELLEDGHGHPFDSSKWGRVCEFLMRDGILAKERIVEPLEAAEDDLLVVPPVAVLPNCLVQQKVLYPFRKQVGGTILAGKLAKERGWAINVGGGFHHCSAERGGGFCAYADISLCIHFAFVQLNISRVMIIDLDAHQGNGHEKDFSDDSKILES